MPINTLQLASKSITVHFTFLDDDIAVTYSPGKLTKKEINGMSDIAIAQGEEAIDLCAQYLCRWVTQWDVMEPKRDANGEIVLDEAKQPVMVMFPLDKERIANELPIHLTMFIVQSLAQGSSLGESNGTRSPNA